MDGLMDVWMGGWKDESMYRCMDGWMAGWVGGLAGEVFYVGSFTLSMGGWALINYAVKMAANKIWYKLGGTWHG